MQPYMFLLIIGVTIMVSGLLLMITCKYTRVFSCVMVGIGGVCIALAIFFARNPYYWEYMPMGIKGDFNDPPAAQEVCEEMSMEVGMTAIACSDTDIQNIENRVNTPVYFQDGDSIYKCDVVFENNERNYYFTSGEDSLKLHKNEIGTN